MLEQVLAATYHQVWWPSTDVMRYPDHNLPDLGRTTHDLRRPGHRACRCPPGTRPSTPSTTTTDAEPAARRPLRPAGRHKGVLGGTPEADELIGYVTKYLTKSVDDCHETTTDRQTPPRPALAGTAGHAVLAAVRELAALRRPAQGRQTQPTPRPLQGAGPPTTTLGIGGRRVLVSRDWSGKTLADHRTDARAWVRAALGVSDDEPTGDTPAGQASPFAWEMARPNDPDVPPVAHRLLRAISARVQNRAAIEAARARERQATADDPRGVSATPTDGTRREEQR